MFTPAHRAGASDHTIRQIGAKTEQIILPPAGVYDLGGVAYGTFEIVANLEERPLSCQFRVMAKAPMTPVNFSTVAVEPLEVQFPVSAPADLQIGQWAKFVPGPATNQLKTHFRGYHKLIQRLTSSLILQFESSGADIGVSSVQINNSTLLVDAVVYPSQPAGILLWDSITLNETGDDDLGPLQPGRYEVMYMYGGFATASGIIYSADGNDVAEYFRNRDDVDFFNVFVQDADDASTFINLHVLNGRVMLNNPNQENTKIKVLYYPLAFSGLDDAAQGGGDAIRFFAKDGSLRLVNETSITRTFSIQRLA